ncbi:glycosyltransferase [Thiothrix subterranea]|uniref:glycosyltransferase n=1 Tax=Thiothrix subterranea TaxID=2735563 RepID=UPI00280B5EF6|nr:glycosyltransferase [Thiothrix subterranea]
MIQIITYHSYISTDTGGVESLIRFIQDTVNKRNHPTIETKIVELFHIRKNLTHESPRENVIYKQITAPFSQIPIISSLARKILFKKELNKLLPKDNIFNIIIITQLKDLFFIDTKILKNKYVNVYLVQTNRSDIWSPNFLLKLLKKKINKCAALSVYTNFDYEIYNRLFSEFNINLDINIIPRSCKLSTAKIPKKMSSKIVSITRIEERQKKISSMLKIMDFLPQRYTLDIYGDGEVQEVNNLKKLITNNNNIRYMGVAHDVKKVLDNYALFIMTSEYEGFGQTLIEARSQGLPIVLFNNFPSAQWIIKDGENGFLVRNNDYITFAKKISAILESENVYKKMSNNALKFSSETEANLVAEKWIDHLKL